MNTDTPRRTGGLLEQVKKAIAGTVPPATTPAGKGKPFSLAKPFSPGVANRRARRAMNRSGGRFHHALTYKSPRAEMIPEARFRMALYRAHRNPNAADGVTAAAFRGTPQGKAVARMVRKAGAVAATADEAE